jgi:hypothetical protein
MLAGRGTHARAWATLGKMWRVAAPHRRTTPSPAPHHTAAGVRFIRSSVDEVVVRERRAPPIIPAPRSFGEASAGAGGRQRSLAARQERQGRLRSSVDDVWRPPAAYRQVFSLDEFVNDSLDASCASTAKVLVCLPTCWTGLCLNACLVCPPSRRFGLLSVPSRASTGSRRLTRFSLALLAGTKRPASMSRGAIQSSCCSRLASLRDLQPPCNLDYGWAVSCAPVKVLSKAGGQTGATKECTHPNAQHLGGCSACFWTILAMPTKMFAVVKDAA